MKKNHDLILTSMHTYSYNCCAADPFVVFTAGTFMFVVFDANAIASCCLVSVLEYC